MGIRLCADGTPPAKQCASTTGTLMFDRFCKCYFPGGRRSARSLHLLSLPPSDDYRRSSSGSPTDSCRILDRTDPCQGPNSSAPDQTRLPHLVSKADQSIVEQSPHCGPDWCVLDRGEGSPCIDVGFCCRYCTLSVIPRRFRQAAPPRPDAPRGPPTTHLARAGRRANLPRGRDVPTCRARLAGRSDVA